MAKVLIVEDDKTIRDAYKTVLELEGHEVEASEEGGGAIKALAAKDFDVILLDMLMPNMNGMELLRELRPKEKIPNTKIIVFSNMSMPETIAEAKELGVSEYLTKARFTPKEVVNAVEGVLKGGQGEKNE